MIHLFLNAPSEIFDSNSGSSTGAQLTRAKLISCTTRTCAVSMDSYMNTVDSLAPLQITILCNNHNVSNHQDGKKCAINISRPMNRPAISTTLITPCVSPPNSLIMQAVLTPHPHRC